MTAAPITIATDRGELTITLDADGELELIPIDDEPTPAADTVFIPA